MLTPLRIVALLGVITLTLAARFAPHAHAAPPNVVILFADDMGWTDLSCYGSTENKTPVLDKLASQGARFTDFYAGSAVCSPSRAAMMTGRFSIRAGVYSWIAGSHKMHLHVNETTTAELLKSAGYETAHIGKWHLGYDLADGSGPGPDPGDHGFDYWIATGNNASPSHHNPKNFVRNGQPVGEMEGYSCQLVVDEAIGWLDGTLGKRDKSKPFFINMWFHEPHQRVAAPPKYTERHKDQRLPEYFGCIENMDNAIGRLLDKLDAMGATDNTLVIFTSDNGSYMGSISNGVLKAGKTKLWEGGIREPAIFRWPGHVKPGTVIDTPAGVVDVLPTVCDAVGVDVPADRVIDGVSLLPVLRGTGEVKRNKPLYWFYSPSRPVCAIRDGDYNLVADPTLDIPTGNMFKEEYIGMIKETGLTNFRLYNLREDPGQEKDLAAEQPQRLEAMKKQMLDLHKEVVTEAIDWRKFEWPKKSQ